MSQKTHPQEPPEAEAFVRRLHADHGAALYGWAKGRFSDTRDAEEVVAESLVKAWRHHDQFDETRGSERSWVFGIARNTAADHHRRSARHLRAVPTAEIPDEAVDSPEIEQLAEASVIREAVLGLSDSHREVIMEAFFAGRTVQQVAARIGVPVGTVKSRLYYGMRMLRTKLEEEGVLL